MSNWFWNAIIALITPYVTKAIDYNMYIVFAFTGVAMSLFTYAFVLETMGKSLEEMGDVFGHSDTNGRGIVHEQRDDIEVEGVGLMSVEVGAVA